MRTLELNETELVAGGVLPATLVPIIKAATPILTTVVTAVAGVITAKTVITAVSEAVDKTVEACKEGADVTVKSKAAEMTCNGNKGAESKGSKDHSRSSPPTGMLKIMLPEYMGGQ